MEGSCFNCGKPPTKRVRIGIESGPDLEDKPICEACYSFFNEATSIAVTELSG